MCCYILSVLAATGVYAIRRKTDNADLRNLNTLLAGGAIFGLVDHAWNGQLFSSPNLANDLLLGVAIVCGIVGFWAAATYGPAAIKRHTVV